MLRFIGKSSNRSTSDQIDKIDELTRQGIRQGFFRLGNELKKEMNREVLKKDKRGRTYIRRDKAGRRRRHVASAKGQTPANRTGTYRKAIGYQLRGGEEMEFGVRASVKYAEFLEDGTRNMAPRPGIGNAVKAKQRDAMTFFESSLDISLTTLSRR